MKIMSKKLCLLWQNAATRKWYHVGNLEFTESEEYIFSYEMSEEKRTLVEAVNDGYLLHPSFPNENEVYKSNKLFNCFARRLPNFKRNDIKKKYEVMGLSEMTPSYEVFSITGGLLAGDNYEFVKPIQSNENCYNLEFYIRGWRHYNEESFELCEHDKLFFEIDENNEHDSNAVKVVCREKVIGYVPAFYSDFLSGSLKNNDEITIEKYVFDKNAPSAFKVFVNVSGKGRLGCNSNRNFKM